MKKRLLCLLLTLLMLFTLPACQPQTENPGGNTGDNGENESTTADPGNPLYLVKDGKALYKLVVSSGASSDVTEAVVALRSKFSTDCGVRPDREFDTKAETDKEILIGLTNRQASQDALTRLGDNDYLIEVVGKKVVVLGRNNRALVEAIEQLGILWQATEEALWISDATSIKKDLEVSEHALMKGDAPAFSVIYSSSLSYDAISASTEFAADLGTLLGGQDISCKKDTFVENDSAAFEILIGATNRPESTEAMQQLAIPGFRIWMSGNKLTLVATDDTQLSLGMDALYIALRDIKNGTIAGEVTLHGDFMQQVNESSLREQWFTSVPLPNNGSIVGTRSNPSDKSCIIERDGATQAIYTAYIATLEAAGFTGGEDYEMGANRYALRHGSKSSVYVSYSDEANTLRVYIEKKGLHQYPAKESSSTTKVCEPKLWQLRVDNIGSRQNGGMSYVYLLSDGTFFIIDGGYDTAAEAQNLVNFLKAKNPNSGKPVVSGWYFSHTHSDHIGALAAVARNYASSIDVKAFYYHFENDAPAYFKTATAAWSKAVHYSRLHTGMQVALPGLTFRVLYTLEDNYPSYPENANDFSTVIQVETKGQKTTFLGDIQKEASLCMLKYIGEDILKSDIVQFAHHGYEGATKAVYNAIAAPTVLWPMNYVSVQKSGYSGVTNVFNIYYKRQTNSEGPSANYYISHQATYCKQIIVAGGSASQEIAFPYTAKAYTNGQSGTNGRLPNVSTEYNRVYAELLPNGYSGSFN